MIDRAISLINDPGNKDDGYICINADYDNLSSLRIVICYLRSVDDLPLQDASRLGNLELVSKIFWRVSW